MAADDKDLPPVSAHPFSFASSPADIRALYPQHLKLELAQVLLRHGERSPLELAVRHHGVPAFWALCTGRRPSRLQSLVLDASTGKPGLLEFEWESWHESINPTDLSAGPVVSAFRSEGREGTLRMPHTATAGGDGGGKWKGKAKEEKEKEAKQVCQRGTLTDRGRDSTYRLGERMRRVYVDALGLLPRDLDLDRTPDLIYLRSTDSTRTRDSVMHVYQGLFPPKHRIPPSPTHRQVILQRPPWQENLFPNRASCARLMELFGAFKARTAAKLRESADMAYADKTLDKLLPNALELHGLPADLPSRPPRLGLDAHRTIDPLIFMDTINSVLAHQADWPALSLPAAMTDGELRLALERAAVEHSFRPYADSHEARTLGVGPLMADLAGRMVGRVEGGGGGMRLALLGGHDTGLGSMLAGLGVFNWRWPQFTSTVVFELFSRREGAERRGSGEAGRRIGRRRVVDLDVAERSRMDGWYVRTLFNDKPVVLPGCKKPGNHLEGNESFCTLEAFKGIVDNITPKNLQKECQENMGVPPPEKPEPAGF